MTRDEFKAKIREQMDASPEGISQCHRCMGAAAKALQPVSTRGNRLMALGGDYIGMSKRCSGCRNVSMSIARNLISFLVKARIVKEWEEEKYVAARPFILMPVVPVAK